MGMAANEASDGTRWGQAVRSLRGHFRSPGRPRIWFELLLIAVSYWLYSLVRNAVPDQSVHAESNAHHIWHFEHTFGFAFERSINHGLDKVGWLIVGMNYYYATLHFIMTIGVLVWLFRSHPARYSAARLALFVTTWIALLGFYFYPLAPPRLMTGGGFFDTVEQHHTWGSLASGSASQVSNQFAAMPSMHIGWSLWCGLTIAFLAKRVWVKVLGALYPVATLVVIIGTANHFFMDAVLGAVCTGVGLGVARLAYGRWAFALPRYPEPRAVAGNPVPAAAPVPVAASVGAPGHDEQHEEAPGEEAAAPRPTAPLGRPRREEPDPAPAFAKR